MMAEFTDIEKQLMERITESRLRDSLALIRNAVEDIWADDAPRIIQDYTDHGIHHSERLADYAAQLLDANNNRSLSAEETYLLLAGIYLHDIGMQCDVVKYPEIKVKAKGLGAKFDVEFTAKTASSYTIDEQKAIRKNHHLLTGAWIDHARCTGETVLSRAIQTVPDDLVGDLIDVCKYHAKLPITECPTTFTLDERGRKQLVAALVRFADELDMDGHRVSIETVKNFRLDPRNAIYWWLHQLTKVTIVGNVITLITRLCPDDEQRCGTLVRDAFIEEFQTKNRPVLSVLQWNNIPIAINAYSGVVAYEYADALPGEIVQTLQLVQERSVVEKEELGDRDKLLEPVQDALAERQRIHAISLADRQVQKDLLGYLYQSWTGEEPDTKANLNAFAQEHGLNDRLVWSEFDLLREKGFMRAVTTGGWVELTTQGVLYMEELGTAPKHRIRENQLARVRILEVLAKIREDGGSYAFVEWTQVALRANLEQYAFLRNVKILEDVGLIQWPVPRCPQITAEGLEKVTQRHRWVRLGEEYRCLEKSDPHKRGHLFEKLLAQVISMDAWACEINVRGPGEEHDIVVHREREYYLIECKWHNEPIGAKTVREFRDRVLASVGVKGILFSISDFTTPAIRDVESRLSDCIILLFGRKDIDALFEGITTFTALLGEKFNAAVSQRKVVV
jgi:hypothetical protein